jgi:predicted dehydrogenase
MRISRRSFATRIGAGTAALQLAVNRAGAQNAQQGQRLRYCIVGLGRISLQHFMPACKMSQYAQVTALVSGHRDKAEKYAAEYNVPAKNIYEYKNFDDIAKNPEIDAVYIALPNSMHAEYTVRAAKAGKHVLCEKPMATSVEDSENMIKACRSANRKLMIAYRCQYEPTNLRDRER